MSINKDETLLIFRIAGIGFAVPAQSVGSILMPPSHITHTPGSNRSTPGIFHHADYTYAIIDLHERFGIDIPRVGSGRLLLHEDGIRHFAFLVDSVVGLVRGEQGEWANLPPYLPQELFSIGFLYQDEIVLCSELTLLRNMHDVEPLRRHFEQLQQKQREKNVSADDTTKTTPPTPSTDSVRASETKQELPPSPPVEEKQSAEGSPGQQSASAKPPAQRPISSSAAPSTVGEKEPAAKFPHTAGQQRVSAKPPAQRPISSPAAPSTVGEKEPATKSPHTTGPQSAGAKPPAQRPISSSASSSTVGEKEPDTKFPHTPGQQSAGAKPTTRSPIASSTVPPAQSATAPHQVTPTATQRTPTAPQSPPPTTPSRTPVSTGEDNSLLWLVLFLLLISAIPLGYWLWPQPARERPSPPVALQESPPSPVVEDTPAEETPAEEPPAEEPVADVPLRIEQDSDGTINMIIDRTAIANSYMPPKRDEPPVDTPVQTEAQQLNATTEETTTEERAAPATQENVVEEFEPATVAQPEPCDCVHIVVEGDTLWDIAERYTGNAFNYPELAKRSRIKNPHRIYPGNRVRIIIR